MSPSQFRAEAVNLSSRHHHHNHRHHHYYHHVGRLNSRAITCTIHQGTTGRHLVDASGKSKSDLSPECYYCQGFLVEKLDTMKDTGYDIVRSHNVSEVCGRKAQVRSPTY